MLSQLPQAQAPANYSDDILNVGELLVGWWGIIIIGDVLSWSSLVVWMQSRLLLRFPVYLILQVMGRSGKSTVSEALR